MGIERRDGWWLWLDGPVPPGYAGITLGPLVVVRRDRLTPRLLAHELEHVRQWRRLGVVRFVARYLGGYLRWRGRGYPHRGAYRRIPLEVEAEFRSRRRVTPAEPTATLPTGPSPVLPPEAAPPPGARARGRPRSLRRPARRSRRRRRPAPT